MGESEKTRLAPWQFETCIKTFFSPPQKNESCSASVSAIIVNIYVTYVGESKRPIVTKMNFEHFSAKNKSQSFI